MKGKRRAFVYVAYGHSVRTEMTAQSWWCIVFWINGPTWQQELKRKRD
jgi:hypothetical protein